MSNGKNANRTGKRLESFVDEELDALGYVEVYPRHFDYLRVLEQPIYARQYPIGLDLYGKNRRIDFILYHPQKWAECLVIQCKWQAEGGSIDEKFAFEVKSIRMHPYSTIIVLDGSGYSKKAKDWLDNEAKKKNKLINVLNQGEFQRFASQKNL